MNFTTKTIQITSDLLLIPINKHQRESIAKIKTTKGYEITVEKYVERKSKNANAYLWVLCDKIAKDNIFKEKRGNPKTDKEVYREAILQKGFFDYRDLPKKEAEELIERWQGLGIGFQTLIEDSTIKGNLLVKTYWGSSLYNREQMSILIDYVVSQAHELGIETLTPRELELLKANWRSN